MDEIAVIDLDGWEPAEVNGDVILAEVEGASGE